MLFRKAETREAETIGFGMLGLLQWIRRESIAKVDRDHLHAPASFVFLQMIILREN